MSEELKDIAEVTTEGAVQEPSEEAAQETVQETAQETMADFANELEASYKEFDQRRHTYTEQEGPNAEAWAELARMLEEKTVTKVKIKEAVKAGVVTYVGEIQGFIPASQISTEYVEKLEDWVGKTIEVVPITVDPEKKKLVLSGRAVMKERQAAEKAEKMAAVKVGAVVEGTVDSLKDYGAFVNLDGGLSGLIHVSQISTQRIKHPGVVLKEGQKVTVKIIGLKDGKISLSMKALEENSSRQEESVRFDYKETGAATTGLGDLLKGISL